MNMFREMFRRDALDILDKEARALGARTWKRPAWAEVEKYIRELGEDPDQIVAEAADNIDAWRALAGDRVK